jgi:hypothetical protein
MQKCQDPIWKITKAQRALGWASVVEYLPTRYKALRSNLVPWKKQKGAFFQNFQQMLSSSDYLVWLHNYFLLVISYFDIFYILYFILLSPNYFMYNYLQVTLVCSLWICNRLLFVALRLLERMIVSHNFRKLFYSFDLLPFNCSEFKCIVFFCNRL